MGKLSEGINDLLSIAPDIAAEWHPTKNGNSTPAKTSAQTNTKVWWLGVCSHEWQTRVSDRVAKNSSCPYCSRRKILIGFNDLATTHPELAKQLAVSQPDDISATQIMAGTNKKALWTCEKGHEWLSIVRHRVNGSKCPYCAGRKVSSGENDLLSKFPAIAAEWHPTKNNEVIPSQIVSGSTKKVWWKCKKGHEWETKIVYRTNENSSCPQCISPVSKNEKELREYIKKITIANVLVFNDRKALQGQELDIYIPEQKLAIEFNGLYWHSEAAGKNKNYHYDKWLACKNQGIQLIQVWEDDWRDRNVFIQKEMKAIFEEEFPVETKIDVITPQELSKFAKNNNINDHLVNADLTIGAFMNNEMNSVMYGNFTKNKNLNIIQYFSFQNPVETLEDILKYVTKNYYVNSVMSTVPNATCNSVTYSRAGFQMLKFLPPSYKVLTKRERYNLNELDKEQLQEIFKYPKIWDAGKTVWVKNFNPE